MKLKEITIELTQQCPNCCVYCSSLSSPSMRTYLSAEQIERTIDDAIELGAKSINLSGGEPFLHPQILEIIDYIYKHGEVCLVYTSGITLHEGKPISIPNEILERTKGKVSKLIVNVEAAEDRTYNQIMGTSFGGFGMMQDTIRRAIAMGITVEAHVVPMKLNLQQLPQIITICNKLGVSRISFLRLVVQGRALFHKTDILMNEKDVTFAKYLITTSANKYKGTIRFGIPFGDCTNPINCMTGISKLDIRYDGYVFPCEAFKNITLDNSISFLPSNINTQSLVEIFHNSEYLNDIRERLELFQSISSCETCIAQYYIAKNLL